MTENVKLSNTVDATPVKSFFVRMLTRDIRLEDSILDLLDNCIDGVSRQKPKDSAQPYKGFRAEITFSKDHFSISDNCGGIPWELHDYAFRMGRSSDRPADAEGTVGVYGIGMKRAIFKMGESCLISTQNGQHSYEVNIQPEWIQDEKNWRIPVTQHQNKNQNKSKPDGTEIVIGQLHKGVALYFGDNSKAFTADLEKLIATHYAFIIAKGFEVLINGIPVKAKPTKLAFSEGENGIKPYIYRTVVDDVEVFLAVGFTRKIPSENDIKNEQEGKKYSSEEAGWTVLCNDRAVVYCDRTELTGWGEAGVPRYHTQFIAISGVVEFRAKDPAKLPTTTTKRGIDASSTLYLQVKNKMREGMNIFINFTNKWKGKAEEIQKYIESGDLMALDEIKTKAAQSESISFNSTKRAVQGGEQYKPPLPMPKQLASNKRRVSFIKNKEEIQLVAEYFDCPEADASEVGEKCFDLVLSEAR